jgi:hypothetical protein
MPAELEQKHKLTSVSLSLDIRECDVPLVGRDLISMERSLTWWNPKPRRTKWLRDFDSELDFKSTISHVPSLALEQNH